MPQGAHDAPPACGADDVQRVPTLADLPADALACILSACDDPVTAALLACTCRSLRDCVLFHPSSDPVWRRWLDRRWAPTPCGPCLPEPVAAPAGRLPAPPARLLYTRWEAQQPAATHVWRPSHGGVPSLVQALCFGHGHTLCSLLQGQLQAHSTDRCGDPAAVLTSREETGHLASLAVCICGGGTLAAVGSADKAVRVFDTRLGGPDPVLMLPGAHYDEVSALAWCSPIDPAPDAAPGQWTHLLATGGGDQTVRLWDLRHVGSSPAMEFDDLPDGVTALAFDCGRQVLYAASGKDVCGLDTAAGEWRATLANPNRQDVHAIVVGTEAVLTVDEDATLAEWARLPSHEEQQPQGLDDEGDEPVSLTYVKGSANGSLSTDATALVGLGCGPAACLVGTWDGRVMLAQRSVTGLLVAACPCFGSPWGGGQEPGTGVPMPVTTLAAQAAVVAVGHSDGALRLMRLSGDV